MMKTIFKDDERVVGPFAKVTQVDGGYIADGISIPDQAVEGMTQVEVADDYQNPADVAYANAKINREMKAMRTKAYPVEADPLFFKSQRGEIPEQEWLDKVTEIKLRYPYVE
jgi:hypothetical protein